jgi:hypothetical protein
MRHRSRLPATTRQWLLTAIAFVALAAQLVVALVPLAEGRDARFASHIEAQGVRTHFTHDDATCAACQARSIHGTTTRTHVSPEPDALAPTIAVTAVTRLASADLHFQDNPRAPPSVI